MSEANFTKGAFSQNLAEHKIIGSECAKCGTQFLPPRPMCPECFSGEMKPVEMGTRGTLAAFTVVHIASTAMIEAGYGRENPHCSGIVELENGLRVSAQILGVDTSQPELIEVGTPLEAVFVTRGEGEGVETFLMFQPIE
ncbi:MAG TPA: Zn-ribbon domain-containing OB-fold protein [Anaerolineales bacterium]|nr:Zn-ribbon domain-containing OB-fold protein [Anaerolineales bacterium]